jgi:two-component system cell cycle response regulator DivK
MRGSVLIVDPDGDTRALYRASLAAVGYDVEEAEDGRQALVKAVARHPAFIVTETRLPFINGYDLCQLVSRDRDMCNVRVVVVSGDAHPALVGRAWSAGAHGVLVKPCLPDTLIEEIRRLTAPRPERGSLNLPAKSKMLRASGAHRPATRTYQRFGTTRPPLPPPTLHCPLCDAPLQYEQSHIGGVSNRHSEQWDDFLCPSCGAFEYRQRTRKLRQVDNSLTSR